MVWVGVRATRGVLGRPISGSPCLHAYGWESGRLGSWAVSRGPGSRYGFSRRRWEGSHAGPDLGCSLSSCCRWRAVPPRPHGWMVGEVRASTHLSSSLGSSQYYNWCRPRRLGVKVTWGIRVSIFPAFFSAIYRVLADQIWLGRFSFSFSKKYSRGVKFHDCFVLLFVCFLGELVSLDAQWKLLMKLVKPWWSDCTKGTNAFWG